MKLTELLIAELDREVPRSRRALAEVPASSGCLARMRRMAPCAITQ